MSNKLSPVIANKPVMFTTALSILILIYKVVDAAGNAEFLLQKIGVDEEVAKLLGSSRGIDIMVGVSLLALVITLVHQVNRVSLLQANSGGPIKEVSGSRQLRLEEGQVSNIPPASQRAVVVPPSRRAPASLQAAAKEAKPTPNLVCIRTEPIPAYEEYGMIMGGRRPRSDRSELMAYVAVIGNEPDGKRKLGEINDVSAQMFITGTDGRTTQVNRGLWLSLGNWVGFEVNDYHQLIIAAATEENDPLLFTFVRDFKSDREEIWAKVGILDGDFYRVKVRLIAESEGVPQGEFHFRLSITRKPAFSVELIEEGDEVKAEKAMRLALVKRLNEYLTKGDELLKRGAMKADVPSEEAAEWAEEVRVYIQNNLGDAKAIEFSKAHPEVVYPQAATNRDFANGLYTLLQRLGALITELNKD